MNNLISNNLSRPIKIVALSLYQSAIVAL